MLSLLDAAGEFHGHIGPWLALGLRAGLLARRRLTRNPFQLRAVVRCPERRPYTCFIDGVQFASGCTMGKGNIRHVPSRQVSVMFDAPGRRRLAVAVRAEAARAVRMSGADAAAVERLGRAIFRRPLEKLFVVSSAAVKPQRGSVV